MAASPHLAKEVGLLSNSLTAESRVEAPEAAIARYGAPEIMKTDQGRLHAAHFVTIFDS